MVVPRCKSSILISSEVAQTFTSSVKPQGSTVQNCLSPIWDTSWCYLQTCRGSESQLRLEQLFLGTLSHGDVAGTYRSLPVVRQLTSGGQEGVHARQPQHPQASRRL
ncbi:hypothetical protein AV530_012060 [Patagioenas fasciata monilis]|uniref:Uncharacterized protein n=1 Tax=Patagioenas fasciata monilis TaxID=372326 RepID=A0A1V4JUQ2_PATFA|nr:hypothetical protein AV530_012060 [Patagioenas fasciata monilis]